MMTDLDNIKELLVNQYLLHEIQHHSSHMPLDDEPTPKEPRAHSLVDIYKCLHQGEFGVGHLIDTPDRFRNRLIQEVLRTQPTSHEPVLENVSINDTVMRLNLKPFKAIFDNDIENAAHILADVCIESSKIATGKAEHFFSLLNGFRDLNQANELQVGKTIYTFPTEMVDHFLKEVKMLAHRIGEIPVFSHSSIYRKLNEPSYRVVDVSVIEQSKLAFLFEQGNQKHS
jgi:hypothetical protein